MTKVLFLCSSALTLSLALVGCETGDEPPPPEKRPGESIGRPAPDESPVPVADHPCLQGDHIVRLAGGVSTSVASFGPVMRSRILPETRRDELIVENDLARGVYVNDVDLSTIDGFAEFNLADNGAAGFRECAFCPYLLMSEGMVLTPASGDVLIAANGDDVQIQMSNVVFRQAVRLQLSNNRAEYVQVLDGCELTLPSFFTEVTKSAFGVAPATLP